MAISESNIKSLEDLNEWIDKCREFAANNWDLMEQCEVVFKHDAAFVGNDKGWDKWKEGGRSISIYLKIKAPE